MWGFEIKYEVYFAKSFSFVASCSSFMSISRFQVHHQVSHLLFTSFIFSPALVRCVFTVLAPILSSSGAMVAIHGDCGVLGNAAQGLGFRERFPKLQSSLRLKLQSRLRLTKLLSKVLSSVFTTKVVLVYNKFCEDI